MTFGYRDEHRTGFVLAFLAALLLFAVGCLSASGQRKLIDAVNEAQLAAAQTYDSAKAAQTDAQVLCAATLRAQGKPLPASPQEVRPFCAAIGAPVPYDPVLLQKAAGPVNALYDAVRKANAARVTLDGCSAEKPCDLPATILGELLGVFEGSVAELAKAGIAVPKSLNDTVAALEQAIGGKP